MSAAVPGTSCAVRQTPLTSLTTNACAWPGLSVYHPPAQQLPADAHDTGPIMAKPPALSAALPGTSCAERHSGQVQDRYAGDLGDYLKFGLLRWLALPGSSGSPQLGVVWYRTADEVHNADGKHVAYLDPGHRSSAQLRQLDPDLYQRLARVVVSGQRSTAALAKAGVLDARTCFFGDLLDFADLPVTARGARLERRRSWAQRALAATSGCDLIFADPDNGIRPASHRVPAHRTKAAKHAYLSELAAFAARGQSLIVYHHAERVRVLG